ncbi:cupin [Citricoccus sp. SGAir0253]|uniref:cupin n=1 Tax=Citricoccus sp. SGAir0253 TaxID=2567881 RepID=UPI0010CCDF1F|nr:cupin [Citricoccus sp. SGAir0253]QCU77315.1 cupin [Citricoccus sp. SGAir0253]
MSTVTGPHDLTALADGALEGARADAHGRHAELLLRDGHLRQTLIALAAGSRLADHNAPPAATVQVLRGALEVTAASGDAQRLAAGQLAALTKERHGVLAHEDSVFLLTTVTGVEEDSHG